MGRTLWKKYKNTGLVKIIEQGDLKMFTSLGYKIISIKTEMAGMTDNKVL